eukprot:TRINITY_DN67882_c0_g1_i1.p1 TRINITY_DN67882_c0_g1~~TRINITY_DN67882_c0_g1_i1.p1  ORF type:complete len:459 (+),score=53.17 TRINITY_DN67882_c0_g1_i1:47-1423(+)
MRVSLMSTAIFIILLGLASAGLDSMSSYTIAAKLGMKGSCDAGLYALLSQWGCNDTRTLRWDPRQGCVVQQFSCYRNDELLWKMMFTMRCDEVVVTVTEGDVTNDTTCYSDGQAQPMWLFNGERRVNVSIESQDRTDAVYMRYKVSRTTQYIYNTTPPTTIWTTIQIADSPWVRFTTAKVCLAFGKMVFVFAAVTLLVYIISFVAIRFHEWFTQKLNLRTPEPFAPPDCKDSLSRWGVKYRTVKDNLLADHTVLGIFHVHDYDAETFAERERFLLLLMTNITNYWAAFLLRPPRSAGRSYWESYKHSLIVTIVVTLCNVLVGQVLIKGLFMQGERGYCIFARWIAYLICAAYLFIAFAFTALEVFIFSFAPIEAAVVSIVTGWIITEPIVMTLRYLALRRIFGMRPASAVVYDNNPEQQKSVPSPAAERSTRKSPAINPLHHTSRPTLIPLVVMPHTN